MERHPDILARPGAVLVVVDVQERINAVMADQRHVPRLSVLLRAFAALGLPVIATEQYPKGLGPTIADLAPLLPGPPLVKETFSCAGCAPFAAALEHAGARRVLLTGIEAHVCVTQTALDLLAAGYPVHVPHDATNSRRTADRERALDRLAAAGAVVTSTESALFELLERCGTADFKAVAALVKELPVN